VLEEGDPPTAAALAGLDAGAAGAAADVLARAGLLRSGQPLAFVHPMVRGAILGAIPASARGRAHRRAAELLAAEPGGRLAEHLLATEPAGDPWVVERLGAAAAAATAAGAPESAAVLLRRVLVEPPAPAARCGLLLALGTAAANAGEPDAVEHLGAALELAATDAERMAAALSLAHAHFRLSRFAEAIEVLDRTAGRLAQESREASALDVMAAGIAAHDADTAPRHARRVDATRRRADTDPEPAPQLLTVAGFIAVLRNEPAATCAALAFRALALRPGAMPGPHDTPWFNQAAITLLWSERWRELGTLMDDAIRRARASGDAGLLSGSLAYRSMMAHRQGALASAEADARLALETEDLPAPMLYRLLNAGSLVLTLVDRGELSPADALLAGLDDQLDLGHGPNAHLKLTRARLRLAQGRPEEALADALAVGDVAERIGIAAPTALYWRSEAAHALLLLGDVAAARRLAEEEVALARAFAAPRTLGVALRAMGLVAGEAATLEAAIAELDRAGAVLEAARARSDLGALLRRGNQRARARELLQRAAADAARLGGGLVAAAAEVELAATGARARRAAAVGRDALTASERRVAELAAEGRTNRDIAQMLFVTAKTVEGHLRQVYLKLGVHGREALPAALARAG
jgi:DNA-binding CsgD family transcriptional regulator